MNERAVGTTTRHYLPTLDGWRGVAILVVLLSHDSLHSVGWLSTGWLLDRGRIGVDIFFALSGLLICTRLLIEEGLFGSINLRTFYLRRFFRIQPAAWVYLLVVSLMMFAHVLRPAWSGVWASVFMIRNYVPLAFHANDWYTAHFWSLAVEEHFYLLLPGFLRWFPKGRAKLLLGAGSLLTCYAFAQRRHPSLAFGWSPEKHTEAAAIGILLASAMAVLLKEQNIRQWCERWANPWITIPIIALLLVAQSHSDRFVTSILLLCAFPAVIISTMVHPASLPSRCLSLAPLRKLGAISYSVYLWQMVFFYSPSMGSAHTSGVLAIVQNSSPLRYAATLVLSLASYNFVERPMVRLGHRLTTRSASADRPTFVAHTRAA